MTAASLTLEEYVATVNIASEMTSGSISRHGAELSCNLRGSKAVKEARVNVTLYA
jgi:hypothetical protein